MSDTHTYMLYGSHMDAHELLNRTLSVYTSFYAAMAKALLKRRTKKRLQGQEESCLLLNFWPPTSSFYQLEAHNLHLVIKETRASSGYWTKGRNRYPLYPASWSSSDILCIIFRTHIQIWGSSWCHYDGNPLQL